MHQCRNRKDRWTSKKKQTSISPWIFNRESMNQEISVGRDPNVKTAWIRLPHSHVEGTLIRSVSPPNRCWAEDPCTRGQLGNVLSRKTCVGVRTKGLGVERRPSFIRWREAYFIGRYAVGMSLWSCSECRWGHWSFISLHGSIMGIRHRLGLDISCLWSERGQQPKR